MRTGMKLLAVSLVTGWAGVGVLAATLYNESFYNDSITNNSPLSAVGWTVYDSTGADFTDAGANPAQVVADGNSPDGDGFRVYMGGGSFRPMIMFSDAPVISSSQRDSELTFSFQHRDADADGNSPLRFVVEVGGAWYVSEVISSYNSATYTDFKEDSISVESSNWYLWSEYDGILTNGFNTNNISSSGAVLTAGDITTVGLMLINIQGGDSYRIDDINIAGTIAGPMTGELIYNEGFYEDSIVNNSPLSLVGWSVYDSTGADFTDAGANPAQLVLDDKTPDGDDYRTYMGGGGYRAMVMLSDAPVLFSAQRDDALRFTFQHRDTDADGSSPIRFLVEVNGAWYVSDEISSYNSATYTDFKEDTVWVELSSWYPWAEYDGILTNGFNTANISSSGAPLATGDITAVGLFLKNSQGIDSYRIDDINIYGTLFDEPPFLSLSYADGNVLCTSQNLDSASSNVLLSTTSLFPADWNPVGDYSTGTASNTWVIPVTNSAGFYKVVAYQ